MRTLPEECAKIPLFLFECIVVTSPCKCTVAPPTKIPTSELSLNTQFLNVADVKLPYNTAPQSLLENSQRVATRVVVSQVLVGISNGGEETPEPADALLQLEGPHDNQASRE